MAIPEQPRELERHQYLGGLVLFSAYLFAALQATAAAPADLPSNHEGRRSEVLSSPNWSDPGNYPKVAADQDEEGVVEFALAVDDSGRPGECRILATSGSESLDSGTCALAKQMRFSSALAADGRPVASLYVNKVAWLLDDPRPVGATWLDADLKFEGKKMTACATHGSGPNYQPWRVLACAYATGLVLKPQFASEMPNALRLSLRMDFRRTSASPAFPEGTILARDETRFTIDTEGNVSRCTPEQDGDIFSNDYRSRHVCGHFLQSLWFEAPKLKETPPTGRYELRLVASQAGQRR